MKTQLGLEFRFQFVFMKQRSPTTLESFKGHANLLRHRAEQVYLARDRLSLSSYPSSRHPIGRGAYSLDLSSVNRKQQRRVILLRARPRWNRCPYQGYRRGCYGGVSAELLYHYIRRQRT